MEKVHLIIPVRQTEMAYSSWRLGGGPLHNATDERSSWYEFVNAVLGGKLLEIEELCKSRAVAWDVVCSLKLQLKCINGDREMLVSSSCMEMPEEFDEARVEEVIFTLSKR